jgi:hypothetical protein
MNRHTFCKNIEEKNLFIMLAKLSKIVLNHFTKKKIEKIIKFIKTSI